LFDKNVKTWTIEAKKTKGGERRCFHLNLQ